MSVTFPIGPSIGARNKKRNFTFVAKNLKLLPNLFRNERIVRLLLNHFGEKVAKLVERKVAFRIRTLANVFPNDLFPGSWHLLCPTYY